MTTIPEIRARHAEDDANPYKKNHSSGRRDCHQDRAALLAHVDAMAGALQEAHNIMQWLAENSPGCLGWVGHNKDFGPWPEIKERAENVAKVLKQAGYDI